jgi:hypothetical protein
LASSVVFVAASSHDYRLAGLQPSTDMGDPSDAVGDEPTPNGSRINLGAFGGTADAERSAPAPVTPDPTRSPVPTETPGIPGTPGHTGDEVGGCGVIGRAPGASSLVLTLAALVLARRRRRR